MSEKSGRLASYLSHIDQAIERIAAYLDGTSQGDFLRDTLLQDAVIRNLEIVGEASRNIVRHHPDFAEAHPELPLQSAYGNAQHPGPRLFRGGSWHCLGYDQT
ncbi:HepT-like ribonuclease domain-containing protein [Rhizobium sp.]